ncbi:FolC bifunctional protein [Xylaria acuta]|nr:FolC bifunctional protein [Xylaria acuta]
MARTYESALSHLAALQSNRAVTSLFAPPAPSSSSSSSSSSTTTTPGAKQDLNALAIPEMQAWLRRAGISTSDLANSGLRCIHVAGTKGKGSVCAYLTALLAHGPSEEVRELAGKKKKVGTYTSPHLVSVRERIAIDGVPISRDLFARYFFEVWDACTEAARAELLLASRQRDSQRGEGEKQQVSEEEEQEQEQHLRGPATKPFYFRFLTLVALRAFLGEGVRSAVVECGIGGEYDSTNVLPAELVTVSVVTQLGIDHVGMLGSTLPEIAWHKAGVCKAGRACFTRRLGGEGGEETMQVLRRRATEKNATLVEVEDADVARWGGVQPSEKGAGSLEGEFQKYNQALAVLAAREHLRVMAGEEEEDPAAAAAAAAAAAHRPENYRLDDIPASFTSALQYARLRGRCETREDERAPVTWLIDGAHTAESLAEVARWFAGKKEKEKKKKKKIDNTKDREGEEEEEDANTILLFNQQDRDAARLVSGLLRDIIIEAEKVAGPDHRVFGHALFARNDIHPRVISAGGEAEAEAEAEAERDLSVQIAAAKAVEGISPGTTTSVLDNVSDAVAEIRTLANQHHNTNGQQRRTTVLVTGSLHLVGALLRTLEPGAED